MRPNTRASAARLVAAFIALVTALTLTTGTTAVASPTLAARTRSAAAAPALASRPTVQRVTLVTGDVVALHRTESGATVATLLPGSPHYGRPVRSYFFDGRVFVVPDLSAAQLRHLDPSVFDVTSAARAKAAGAAALRVTFAAGTPVRPVAGLRLDTAAARTLAGGARVVPARLAGRPDLAALPPGVSISGTTPAQRSAAGDFELFTVVLKAERRPGVPLDFAFVEYMNTDDASLGIGMAFIDQGEWRVSLPAGHYWIQVDDFFSQVVHEITVSGDMTETFSLTEATMRPRISVADQRALEKGVTMIRTDATGLGSFSSGISGMVPKLSPVPAPPPELGTLTTTVEGSFTRSARGDDLTQLTHARAYADGIPPRFERTYDRPAFARVPWRAFRTGPSDKALAFAYGFVPDEHFAFISGFEVPSAGETDTWLLGDDTVSWYTMTASERAFGHLMWTQRSYDPGPATALDFFRSPNGPGFDSGHEGDATGRLCDLCVGHDRLRGALPLLSAAGGGMFGLTLNSPGNTWALKAGSRTLGRGDGVISMRMDAPAAGTELTLSATSLTGPRWTLSTKVSDEWTFPMPGKDGTVPLLRADYAPPTTLDSTIAPGRVTFPITFDNLGPIDARVVKASVAWSSNHTTWHDAALTRVDANTFDVSYPNPSSGAGGSTVSFRIKAEDAAGRTVEEQALDAYALVPGKAASRRTTSAATFDPRRLCRTSGVGTYSCFARLQAWKTGPTPKRADPAGWGAPDLRDAYDVPATGSTDTVGIVVAYDYPKAEKDLNAYRAQYGLPPCTSASGCFTKINQDGQTGSYPRGDMNWGVEAALDLQMVTAACPTCHIVLAEANNPTTGSLKKATAAAMAAGATVTNHSYGIQEYTRIANQAGTYDKPGVTSVVASGDFGFTAASYPASVPGVVSVGGTVLTRSTDPRGWSERAWAFGGSGCSAYFAKPSYQTDSACHMRTFADMSAVAWELAVYDTYLPKRYRGWLEVGGTSASSPFTAGLIAAAGAGGLKPGELYPRAADFNDIVTGRNGSCLDSYLCTALPGFDAPTGWGTPHGVDPFTP